MRRKAATRTDRKLAVRLAALSSLGAAAIHFAVTPGHWQEWMPAGVFFTAIGLFQLMWALLVVVRQTPALLVAGILANLAAAMLWALSRTSGSPFGPHAGQPEAVDTAGICTLMLQSYVIMAPSWLRYRRDQAEPISGFSSISVLIGATTVIAIAATSGVASGLTHSHHAPAREDSDHHPSDGDQDDLPHPHPEQIDSTRTQPAPGPTTPEPAQPHSPATDVTGPAHEPVGDHPHNE